MRINSDALLRGSAAGLGASVIQVMIGKAEEILLLPPGEDSNIAPRLMARLAEDVGEDLSDEEKWALGTAFHLGYAVFWGAAYAAARERYPVSPLVGGGLLGSLIYGITFTRWGGAVQTDTERPPEERSDEMTVVAASVALSFGITTAYFYEWLRERN